MTKRKENITNKKKKENMANRKKEHITNDV